MSELDKIKVKKNSELDAVEVCILETSEDRAKGSEQIAKMAAYELNELKQSNSALQARVEALKDAVTKSINLFKEIANDQHCDNDGRGCGSGWRSDELATELEAILKGEK